MESKPILGHLYLSQLLGSRVLDNLRSSGPSQGRESPAALETGVNHCQGFLQLALPGQSVSGKSRRERSWWRLDCEASFVASDWGCRTMSSCRCLDIQRHQRRTVGWVVHVPYGPWDIVLCGEVYAAETPPFEEAWYTIESSFQRKLRHRNSAKACNLSGSFQAINGLKRRLSLFREVDCFMTVFDEIKLHFHFALLLIYSSRKTLLFTKMLKIAVDLQSRVTSPQGQHLLSGDVEP